jgi:type I restriction enzyme S subunit
MNAELVLKHFDRIGDAPDAIPRLRRFILDLAVRGKLVVQDPTDEPGTVLLKRMQEQKCRLIRQGVTRQEKPLPTVAPEDIPFTIPTNWGWARIGETSTLITKGSTPTSYGHSYQSSGVNFIKVEAIRNGQLLPQNVTSFISDETHAFMARSRLAVGDILFSIAGSIGTCACVSGSVLPANTNQALAIIRGTEIVFNPTFVLFCIKSSVSTLILSKARGGAMSNISLEDVRNFLVPVPPLKEQHRIVAKVAELMALCDKLQEAKKERENQRDRLAAASHYHVNNGVNADTFRDDANFYVGNLQCLTTRPDQIKQLRQTILNLAVRGKLLHQDRSDEPASELLKRIQMLEKSQKAQVKLGRKSELHPLDSAREPFKLPSGWTWARFPELGLFGRGKSKHRPRNDQSLFEGGTHLLVQTGDVARSNGVIKTFTSKYNNVGLAQSLKWPKGTLCITIAANIADSGILTFDACFPDSVVGFIPSSVFPNARYFEYFIRTAKADLLEFAPATAQKNINLEILNAVLIPLPPLPEQQRIVARVDELMALCDHLETQLTIAQVESSRLLESVLHHALSDDSTRNELVEQAAVN